MVDSQLLSNDKVILADQQNPAEHLIVCIHDMHAVMQRARRRPSRITYSHTYPRSPIFDTSIAPQVPGVKGESDTINSHPLHVHPTQYKHRFWQVAATNRLIDFLAPGCD